MVIFLCLFPLMFASCGLSSEQQVAETQVKSTMTPKSGYPTVLSASTDTRRAPTSTLTASLTQTPTVVHQSTATLSIQTEQSFPTLVASYPVTITHITMFDVSTGWAIGHQPDSGNRILYTQDGGFSWEERTPVLQDSLIEAPSEIQVWAYFYDSQTAWAIFSVQHQPPVINAPVVWHTTDAGITWLASEELPIIGEESFFIPENFSFIDPINGWLLVHVDAGMSHDFSNLFSTGDGGITWERLIDPYKEGLQSLENTGLRFADIKFGWVTKDNLGILPGAFFEQTRDGGLTWEDVFLPTPDEFDWFDELSQCATSQPIFFESAKAVILVNCRTFDEQAFTYTYIYSIENERWLAVSLPTSVESLFFLDNKIGWALGRDLYQSTDGGLSWVRIKTVNWDGQFSFVNTKFGWAVASNEGAVALVFTQDGGRTWQQITPKIIKSYR
jgi:photosystem II stability/assembly factor-like uncharacterized protein